MENQVVFENFEPADDMRMYVENSINELSPQIPDDGNFYICISQKKGEVLAEIKIAASQLHCNIQGCAKTFYAALDRAIGEVERELCDWRATRLKNEIYVSDKDL